MSDFKIIFEVDNLDIVKTGKLKIVLNNDESHAITHDMKDLPIQVNDSEQNKTSKEAAPNDPDDDLIRGHSVGSNFYYDNIAADEEWFFDTYYRK